MTASGIPRGEPGRIHTHPSTGPRQLASETNDHFVLISGLPSVSCGWVGALWRVVCELVCFCCCGWLELTTNRIDRLLKCARLLNGLHRPDLIELVVWLTKQISGVEMESCMNLISVSHWVSKHEDRSLEDFTLKDNSLDKLKESISLERLKKREWNFKNKCYNK